MAQEHQNELEKLVGQVLANTYRLEQLLTSGGMGAIYRARHLRTGGTCAVKILHSRSAQWNYDRNRMRKLSRGRDG